MNSQNICQKLSLILFISVIFYSCNAIENDWEKARNENTIEGYETFIEKYPESAMADSANLKMTDLQYTWNDGFLERKYNENEQQIFEGSLKEFSLLLNPDNSMIVGMEQVEDGSVTTFATSNSGQIKFTELGAEGMVTISVKVIDSNGDFVLGIKVNEGDKTASLDLHRMIVRVSTE